MSHIATRIYRFGGCWKPSERLSRGQSHSPPGQVIISRFRENNVYSTEQINTALPFIEDIHTKITHRHLNTTTGKYAAIISNNTVAPGST